MTVKDAVAKRFEQLCDQRGIRPNELATRAGVTPSTVYSMLDPYRYIGHEFRLEYHIIFHPLPCCSYYVGIVSIPSMQLSHALEQVIFALKRPLPITFL